MLIYVKNKNIVCAVIYSVINVLTDLYTSNITLDDNNDVFLNLLILVFVRSIKF